MRFEKVISPLELYRFPFLDGHGFTTFVTGRGGGVSRAPYETLNTAASSGDPVGNVAENMSRIETFLGTGKIATCNQVHSDEIVTVDSSDPGSPVCADAIMVTVPNVAVAVRTADCLPAIIVDPINKAACAVHAGRKGTELAIIGKAVEKMSSHTGSDPSSLVVGIGPCIHQCCYEVDEESAELFHTMTGGNGGRYIDIVSANIKSLINAGVDRKNIHDSDICTSCENRRFFSYRSDNQNTGRFLTGVMIQGKTM